MLFRSSNIESGLPREKPGQSLNEYTIYMYHGRYLCIFISFCHLICAVLGQNMRCCSGTKYVVLFWVKICCAVLGQNMLCCSGMKYFELFWDKICCAVLGQNIWSCNGITYFALFCDNIFWTVLGSKIFLAVLG